MTIPRFQDCMLPLLEITSDKQEHTLKEAVNILADEFDLTPAERQQLSLKTTQRKFDKRVNWALNYLKRAKLLESRVRGEFHITERGLAVLAQEPDFIDEKFLRQFPEFTNGNADKTETTSNIEEEETEEEENITEVTAAPKTLATVTHSQILAALEKFDRELRDNGSWDGWEESSRVSKGKYKYGLRYDGLLYPPKLIYSMAGGGDRRAFNTYTAQKYLTNLGFEIVELEPMIWPALDGPAFVVVDKYGATQQEAEPFYIFDLRASGDSRKLAEAVRAQQMGGKPVYFIIYQPGPAYSFVGWAKVATVSGDDQNSYRLELEQHSFPKPLNLKSNGATLLTKIAWLHNGLKPAFNYRSIRKITDDEFNTIIATARQEELSLEDAAFAVISEADGVLGLADIYQRIKAKNYYEANFSESDLNRKLMSDSRFNDLGENKWSVQPTPPVITRLPDAWSELVTYWNFVQLLEKDTYTAAELLQEARAFGEDFNPTVEDLELATNLCQLRLLRLNPPDPSQAEPTYSVQPHASGDQQNPNEAAILRLMALGLLLPAEGAGLVDSYELLARRTIPRLQAWQGREFGKGAGLATQELGDDEAKLLDWYAEAGLLEKKSDEVWAATANSLRQFGQSDVASQTYDRFLQALLAELAGQLELTPVSGNRALAPISEDELNLRLAELGQHILIDSALVRRIYRSLMAGRHVVLSGPPGTGKTELAKRLPELLWRERLEVYLATTGLDTPPVELQVVERHGYKPLVVTATEDWGVSDVIGGIRPKLGKDGQSLSYTIQYGHLTRTIFKNYAGLDKTENLAAELPQLQRSEYRDETGKRYAGVWLVIDEFTRAPVDAAFGSLLTTLSGSATAALDVPTAEGSVSVPLPRDFRIIGTLNSFDRHFLNQMSEALKRRFDFIDVLPPVPQQAQAEHNIATANALKKLQVSDVAATLANPQVDLARDSFKRIFGVIRIFRQLGTAQAEAVYLNLFSGALIAGMSWPTALDAALADSLADQLQVLNRDEQRILLAYLSTGHDTALFLAKLKKEIFERMPQNRRAGLLQILAFADSLANPSEAEIEPIATDEKGYAQLTESQIARLFKTGGSLDLPPVSQQLFYARLNSMVNERGL